MEIGQDRPLVVGSVALRDFCLARVRSPLNTCPWAGQATSTYMPSDGVDKLGGRVNDGLGITRFIRVVVVGPYLGVQTGSFQGRPDVVLDERPGLVGINVHGRVSGLAVERLILNGDGVDACALVCVRLDILDKVLRIGVDVGVVQVVLPRV